MTRQLLALALVAAARVVLAHPLAPALLDVRETGDGRAAVTWKQSRYAVPGAPLTPVLPAECTPTAPPVDSVDDGSVTSRWTVACARSLVGTTIGVDGLGPARTDALLRLALADGRVVQRVLRAGAPSLTVPERPSRVEVLRDYARLGVEHILTGADHLLFVLGLLLLVPATRPLVRTITAFTVGHSVTLSLVVLGVWTISPPVAELAIALTVLALAVELTRDGRPPTLMRRAPWAMALAFGLLHGLGFAGALREVGLPDGEIPLALCSFNVGIELGQLAFVVAALSAAAAFRRAVAEPPAWARLVPIYTIGSLAAFWCFERAAALVGG